jgi:hypothetical protein
MSGLAPLALAVGIGGGGYALREYGQRNDNNAADRTGNAIFKAIVYANVASLGAFLLTRNLQTASGIGMLGMVGGAVWGATHGDQ